MCKLTSSPSSLLLSCHFPTSFSPLQWPLASLLCSPCFCPSSSSSFWLLFSLQFVQMWKTEKILPFVSLPAILCGSIWEASESPAGFNSPPNSISAATHTHAGSCYYPDYPDEVVRSSPSHSAHADCNLEITSNEEFLKTRRPLCAASSAPFPA